MAYDAEFSITKEDFVHADYPEFYYRDGESYGRDGKFKKNKDDLLSYRDFILRNKNRSIADNAKWHELNSGRIDSNIKSKVDSSGKMYIREGTKGNPALFYQRGELDTGKLSWSDFVKRNPNRSIKDNETWGGAISPGASALDLAIERAQNPNMGGF